jgi:hypothetical protein
MSLYPVSLCSQHTHYTGYATIIAKRTKGNKTKPISLVIPPQHYLWRHYIALNEKGKQRTNGGVAVFLTNFFALPEGGARGKMNYLNEIWKGWVNYL